MNTTRGVDVSVTGPVRHVPSRIVEMVEDSSIVQGRNSGHGRSFCHDLHTFSAGLAAAIAIVGGLATGDWADWFYRGLILLVVACPCAL